MNTHESYCSLETAKMLKEAGFDWDCRGIRVLDSENDPEPVFSTATFKYHGTEVEGYIKLPAPTLDVAQRWLREVKDEYVVIEIVAPSVYKVSILGRDCTSKSFKTYEEAQEAGIKKALELILEKGE